LAAPFPGDDRKDHGKNDRVDGVAVQRGELRYKRSHANSSHQNSAVEDGPRPEQKHGAEDLGTGGNVAKPLPEPNLVELLDRGGMSRQLENSRADEGDREEYSKSPGYGLRARACAAWRRWQTEMTSSICFPFAS
jgi:hypothetical protein